jgi:hypothetical protein
LLNESSLALGGTCGIVSGSIVNGLFLLLGLTVGAVTGFFFGSTIGSDNFLVKSFL